MDNNIIGGEGKNIMKKIILPIFLLVILLEIILGIRTLTRPIQPAIAGQKISPLTQGRFALVADNPTHTVGDTLIVSIRLDTGGFPTDGSDLYLKFDPQYLSAVSAVKNLTVGSIYGQYPVVAVNPKTGIVNVSGIVPIGQKPFSGLGEFGRMSFKVIKAGSTSLVAQYQTGSTIYSNIIESGTANNLNSAPAAVNLTLTPQPSASSANSSCAPMELRTCKDESGRVGSFWCSSINDPFSCRVGCFMDEGGKQPGCNIVVAH